MPRIIISSNRTSNNPGKKVDEVSEVDITRKIAANIVPHLRSSGVLTLSTPKELESEEKINWINKTGYSYKHKDIAIEIHMNQGDTNKSGSIAWYSRKDGKKSSELADNILSALEKESEIKNQGIFSETSHPNKKIDFLSKIEPIAVIIGVGFIDNKKDVEYLSNDDNLRSVGIGVAKGILKYLNVEFKESKNQVQKINTNTPVNTNNNNLGLGSSNITPPAMGANRSLSSPPAGGLGGFNNPGNLSGGLGSGGGIGGGGNNYMASRDERKKMIQENYERILGREPNQSDLNYFLNTGINEEQLIKKMVNSQEHVDLVKARQEVLTTTAQFHAMQAKILMLEAGNDDKAEMLKNQNALIQQKNKALYEMHRKIQQYEQRMMGQPQGDSTDQKKMTYNKSFTDGFLDFFSDRLGS